MNMLVTNAGLAALVNAEATGTDTITISQIKFGSGQYTPTKTQTAMQTPFKTLTALSGGAVSANTLHVTAEDASTETYSVYEVGVFLSDGTLFAVGSQTTAILQKASGAIALLSVDIALADHSAATVTVGDTNFFNPQATTETKGVVELATDDETKAGTDATRAVTPASLKAELDVRDSKVVHTTGNETIAGIKKFTGAVENHSAYPEFVLVQTDMTKGTAPATNQGMYVRFCDESRKIVGQVSHTYSATKDSTTKIVAFKSSSSDDTKYAEVTVQYPADESPYATAPTPADANDSSTKIATTAWVQTLAGKYLPLAGGNMTGTIAARHSIDDATTVPSSNQYQTALILKDKNNQAFGHIQTASYADTGKLLVKMSIVDGLRNGSTYEGTPATHFIGIGMDESGTPYTVAPNPPADDDSDQIATTAWVRNTFDSMIDDEGVVHVAGNETITGAKTFSATTTMNGVVNLNATVIGGAGRDIWFAHVAGATSNRSVIQSGNAYQDGASFYLNAKDYATNGGSFQINAHDGTNVKSLLGKPDGTLTWSGKSVLTSENETTLKYLIDETQFSVTALGKSFNYGLLWLCVENFEDTADVNTSIGAGGSVADYYDATNHLIVKTGTGSIVLQSKSQTCSKNNATAWAYPDWTGSGSLKVEISRDGGTTFTTVASDTMKSISTQPTGTSMVCRLTLTGQVTLKNIAWGCK